MGYNFYNPHENKVSVARQDELFENSLKCTRSDWESHFAKSESKFSSYMLTLLVGIKSLLDAVRITAAQVYVNTALM
ncbi:hypothetical protein Tco_0640240, partial [Tanacetum coccineum]